MNKPKTKKFCTFGFRIMLSLVLLILIAVTSTKTTYALNERDRLDNEIIGLIEDGVFPEWHEDYLSYQYYHKLYNKYKNGSLPYFANLPQSELNRIMNNYFVSDQEWLQIMENFSVPVSSVAPNQPVGLFFNGQSLYFIWSSEYIPDELLNLSELTLNGKVYRHEAITNTCVHLNGDGFFEVTYSYHFPKENIQLNMTPIGLFHECQNASGVALVKSIGVEMSTSEFKIQGFKAELDSLWGGLEEDPAGIFKITSNVPATFNLTNKPVHKGKPSCQLITHCFIDIIDCEAQSVYDVIFGGYKHYVYFNTSLNLDTIYRVDVAYSVVNDKVNILEWLFKLGYDEKDVLKSLTPKKNQAGLFNFKSYQGLSTGTFASNEKDKTYYQYRLHLNYDESDWNITPFGNYAESDYQRIKTFKILRLNFLYQGEEFDVDVKMDSIEGSTLNIFSRELVLDTSSVIWSAKEAVYDTRDTISNILNSTDNIFGKAGKAVVISVIAVASIALLYFLYKLIKGISKLFKK